MKKNAVSNEKMMPMARLVKGAVGLVVLIIVALCLRFAEKPKPFSVELRDPLARDVLDPFTYELELQRVGMPEMKDLPKEWQSEDMIVTHYSGKCTKVNTKHVLHGTANMYVTGPGRTYLKMVFPGLEPEIYIDQTLRQEDDGTMYIDLGR